MSATSFYAQAIESQGFLSQYETFRLENEKDRKCFNWYIFTTFPGIDFLEIIFNSMRNRRSHFLYWTFSDDVDW